MQYAPTRNSPNENKLKKYPSRPIFSRPLRSLPPRRGKVRIGVTHHKQLVGIRQPTNRRDLAQLSAQLRPGGAVVVSAVKITIPALRQPNIRIVGIGAKGPHRRVGLLRQ